MHREARQKLQDSLNKEKKTWDNRKSHGLEWRRRRRARKQGGQEDRQQREAGIEGRDTVPVQCACNVSLHRQNDRQRKAASLLHSVTHPEHSTSPTSPPNHSSGTLMSFTPVQPGI